MKVFSLVGKAIASGVDYPGVVARALLTGVQSQGLPGQLPGSEGAGLGQDTQWLAWSCTLPLLPGLEVPQLDILSGGLHPLQHLSR